MTHPSHKKLGARKLLMFLAVTAIAALLVAELTARVMTRTNELNGMPMINRFALLPYRPDAQSVRRWTQKTEQAGYIVRDAELGWTIAPNAHAFDGLYQTNTQAVRTAPDRVFASSPPANVVRIVTVGDSFTHGDEVANDQTWQYHLESQADGLEMLNLGVGGYGTDQALLRWRRDGRAFNAHITILGIWPENICRNLSIVRYYLQPNGAFMTKPRFVIERDQLRLINSPVLAGEQLVQAVTNPDNDDVLAFDYWCTPDVTRRSLHLSSRVSQVVFTLNKYRTRRQLRSRLYSGDDTVGIEITAAIAEQFAREVEASGSIPVVLLIPMRDLLATYHGDKPLPLVQMLRKRGLAVVDMSNAMWQHVNAQGMAAIYQSSGHLTPQGNRLMAQAMQQELTSPIEMARDSLQKVSTSIARNNHD